MSIRCVLKARAVLGEKLYAAGFTAEPTAGGRIALETEITGLEEPLYHG